MVVVCALWWLYFDVAALFVQRRLTQATGLERARLGRDAYSYLHLPMIAGIVLFALGLRTTLHHTSQALDTVPAIALCAGTAIYLVAQVAFLHQTVGRIFRRRTIGALVLLVLIPAALAIPHSRPSPSSPPSAHSSSPTRRSDAANPAPDSATGPGRLTALQQPERGRRSHR